ncbi:non-heme iron oxygenase ferredoxin subunit [Lapillicoccus jejuensis]|uniref:3-phenylpropionate/trans-cinnamate dioxygenase ferredoxin subunit n=1 Tax=Lapillicoccus jejuensis TaxID=402171 RepID=A0A542E475_9MICO|nr:non-heme iron oxygenase ferredoxin subunit [Lapillicoccus jejuensis]TQJ10131.1 3-phenylpropionate/trans-cinnamate dioxygenase ferredoxin subunit [Lapillicoccus jejuensis]
MSAQPDTTSADAQDGFTPVCAVGDVAPGTAARADVDGRIVALVRDADGGWHCVDDRCTHADVSLAEGEVDGCTLECWLHGSRFDLRTGEPSGPPATRPVAVHEVRVDGDDVLVRLSR